VLSESSFLALSCCGGGGGGEGREEWGETMGNVWNDTEFIRCHVLRKVHKVLLGTMSSSSFENFLEQFVYCLKGKEVMALSNHNKNQRSTKVGGGTK
jgi:hypothetical protein